MHTPIIGEGGIEMSNFCAACGTATGGGKFCPKCGSPQGGGAAAQSSISQMPYAPAPRKSPVLKIILLALGLFLVLGGVLLVKGYYFLKETVHEAKQQIAESKVAAEKTEAGCDLLSKEDVSRILGSKIAATKGNEAGDMREYCNYLSPANIATAAANKDDDSDKEPDFKNGGPSLDDLQNLAKQISKVSKNKPMLSVQIFRGNASVAVFGIKTASRLTGSGVTNVPGPWDEAYFAPEDSAFVVRKGHNGLVLDLTQLDNKRESGPALAKAMVPSL